MKKIAITLIVLLCMVQFAASPEVAAQTLEVLCRVDIGDPASEAGHNLVGWGLIEPATHPFPGTWGWGFTGNARVIWEPFNDQSPCATLTLDRHIKSGVARAIHLRHLDGIAVYPYASDDSFDVYVMNRQGSYVKVFHYSATRSRTWVETIINLDKDINGSLLDLDVNGNINVKLCATGIQWQYFYSDLGQVPFDWIELLGDSQVAQGEGLTPGYWKNHLKDWPVSPRTAMWRDYFPVGDPSWTLLKTIDMNGGGCKALARHATTAILNALHPDVDYPLSVSQIVALVQNAYNTGDFETAKNLLDRYNNLGCHR